MISTIDELFDISYGQSEYESKGHLDAGDTILISSKGDDNGCYGFFDIPAFYKAPFITVPRTGTIGQAFVQLIDCCANSDCLVLVPKAEMSVESLYQVAYQIRKNKWRYQYGRKITPARLGSQPIRLEDSSIDVQALTFDLTPKSTAKKPSLPSKVEYKTFDLTDLCDISKRSALPQNQLNKDGDVPYVTTSSKNNGVSEFVAAEPNAKANTLTVALNGSCGETFYQFKDYITSGDNAVVELKGELFNPFLLMYIGHMIERQKWKYNYYRKLTMTKLKKFKIPVPVSNGEIDTQYIEDLIRSSYGYQDIMAAFVT